MLVLVVGELELAIFFFFFLSGVVCFGGAVKDVVGKFSYDCRKINSVIENSVSLHDC